MKKSGRVALGIVLSVAVWTLAGCEDHTIGGELVDAVKGHDSDGGGQRETAPDVSGTWKGKAGTAQGSTTLRLQQNGTSLSGSWVWGAHDTRTCSGYRSGSTICLWDNQPTGDSWKMTLSKDGTQMRGSAKKYGGGTYALSFSR